jgi:hypothetical protein
VNWKVFFFEPLFPGINVRLVPRLTFRVGPVSLFTMMMMMVVAVMIVAVNDLAGVISCVSVGTKKRSRSK